MGEVLFRVTQLFSRRAVLGWWVAVASVGVALTWLPLMDQPGYELSTGLCLLLGIAGLAIAAPDPLGSAIALCLATLPSLVVATLRTSFGTPCNPFSSVAFVPILILPTAALVAVLGALARRIAKRWWLAALVYFGLAAITDLSTIWPVIAGPQVFAFNHLGGYFPGPLYDEELSVPSSLLWFRFATICLALGLGALLSRRRRLGAVLLVIFGAIELAGTPLRFRMTDTALADALGGVVETNELILHYPQGLSDVEVSRVLGDLRFRHHQIVEFFGAPPPGKVTVWLYRSPEEKQSLVGAAHTQFAKPWRQEVHVNGLGFPHPVIKHELVHAMAAFWGAAPFGVPSNVGVVEGFAVAADNPVDELSVHEWAAAMKKKGLLPDVASLMTAIGFYAPPPSRAYATAGSFLRFLSEKFGKDKLRSLYRDADFQRAFGAPLPALAQQYETFLDTVPLEPDAVNQAFARFRRGSLFDRPCAREVGRLAGEAQQLLSTDPERARELLARCRALQPDEPSHALAEANALRRLSQDDASRRLLDSELERLEQEPSPWAEAALTRADLAQQDGDLETATRLWKRIIERQISPAMERTSQVRLDGLQIEAVQRYFRPDGDDVKLFLLREAVDSHPEAWSVRYLIARKLQLAGEPAAAFPLLEKLVTEELPLAVAKESTRLSIEAAFSLGRCDQLQRWAAAPGRFGPAFDARAADWVERCAFAWPEAGR